MRSGVKLEKFSIFAIPAAIIYYFQTEILQDKENETEGSGVNLKVPGRS